MSKVRQVLFIAKEGPHRIRDGQYGWTVTVDGQYVCEVESDEMDVAAPQLQPLWETLNISVEFNWD